MRWLVEVMTLGKTETESLHVDGESWQKALQAAREKRGESAPMSGFSIELSDDGCRAVDSMSRLRYDVRRVPEAAAAPSPRSAPPAPFPLAEPEAPSWAPDAAPAPQPLQAAQPPRPTSQPPRATKRPSLSPSAAAVMLGPAAAGATRPVPAPVVPVAAAAAAPAPAVAGIPSQVIFKREEDATDSVPLTYREYVFLVPVGTSEKAAEALLRTQLELVRASLLRSPAGKLVNLGVFDVAFQGKPPVPPLSTLMWKDWRDDPVIEFPRRPGYKRRPASVPPTDTATRPKVVSPPLDQRAPASAPPPAASQSATQAADTHVPAPAAMVVPAPVAAVAAAAVPATALADGSPPAVVPAPAPREVPAPS
ncbi:MAG TPA: hypothetical protein VN894_17025, partial [Polyangiaceae bacterium]|nr:hypothetical protein [Polyangiaceae bacterium]